MSSLSYRRLLALCRKEFYQVARDPSSIIIAFVLPSVLLIIFGYGINLDSGVLRVAVAQEDSGIEAQRFVQALMATPHMSVDVVVSRSHGQRLMEIGHVRGLVVIRSDFSAKLTRGQGGAAIQVLADGSEPNTATFVSSYVQDVWQIWQQQRMVDSGASQQRLINIEPRYWFNPSTISRNFLVPGSIAIVMTVIGALLTSLVVAREWERGTMEALLSTPVTRMELLLSKIIPYYLLGMASMVLCVLLAISIMGVPFRGSFFILFVVSSLFLGGALGLGLFLSTSMKNQFNAAQAALTAAFMPAVMLSGFVFEISSMPSVIQVVTYMVPARYFVSALQTLFQAGTLWPVLMENMLFLLILMVLWLALTAAKTGRRLDT